MARVAQAGDRVLLIDRRRRRHIITLEPDKRFHTDKGVILHNDLIGRPYGRQVYTHIGEPFIVLQPSIADLAKAVRRITQIVYPKDSGYILIRMNVHAGMRIIEGGTGSGSLTMVLAHAVMPTGHVYSYERRPEMSALAAENLAHAGLDRYVTLHVRDIAEGFIERDVDGVFLDVREPWLYLAQSAEALTGGGFFGALVPTTNQVSALLEAMEGGPWYDVEVVELLMRRYKVNAQRLRPEDRMVAHTAYLIFARYVPDYTAAEEEGEEASQTPSEEEA